MKSTPLLDLFAIESQWTEEQRMVRDSVRSFARKAYLPGLRQWYRDEVFPNELIPQIGALGVLGANLEGYGCAGMDATSYGLIMREIEYVDSGLRSFVSVQGALCMYPIYAYGSEEQKDRYLPKMATGEVLGCFGLTEPDHGSNPGGMITSAEDKGDHYLLNGAKMWITNGGLAHIAIVWAKLDGEVVGFIVPTDSEGFSAPEQRRKWSLRCSVTSELVLQDVKVSKDALMPKARGLKTALGCLTQARYGIAYGANGAAMACYDAARDYSLSRIQFDKPIASFQLIQTKLANMLTEITKAQLVTWRLGRLKEEGKMTFAHVSMAKRNNVGRALEISRVARDMLGANGITDEYPVGRHMCNLETVNTYEGTYDIHGLILGEKITGIQAYQ